MAEMTLSNHDRRALADLITRRAGVLTLEDRLTLLENAGLEEVLGGLSLAAPAHAFSQQLVRKLQDRGTLSATGQPALVSLVRELRALVEGHEDEVAFLDGLLMPYPEPGSAPTTGPAPSPLPGRLTVLFLAANPRQTTALRLGEEVRTIEERLRESDLRERFDLVQEHAVRWTDVSRHLLEHSPHIVHFAGHGEAGGELVFEDEVGRAWPIQAEVLGDLFRVLKGNIRCAVLNACWSDAQARAIVAHVDYVVGMTRPVPDDAAIRFAGGFYRGLGFRRGIQTAFDLGRNEMSATRPSDSGRHIALWERGSPPPEPEGLSGIPRLLVRDGAEPAATALTEW